MDTDDDDDDFHLDEANLLITSVNKSCDIFHHALFDDVNGMDVLSRYWVKNDSKVVYEFAVNSNIIADKLLTHHYRPQFHLKVLIPKKLVILRTYAGGFIDLPTSKELYVPELGEDNCTFCARIVVDNTRSGLAFYTQFLGHEHYTGLNWIERCEKSEIPMTHTVFPVDYLTKSHRMKP
jgi:hypothetical protein